MDVKYSDGSEASSVLDVLIVTALQDELDAVLELGATGDF